MVWLHTFSRPKCWINGLTMLNEPLLQFHTQLTRRCRRTVSIWTSRPGTRLHMAVAFRLHSPYASATCRGFWSLAG
ncbi:hypothetical protein ACNKHL_00405 [Shigella flexneri]